MSCSSMTYGIMGVGNEICLGAKARMDAAVREPVRWDFWRQMDSLDCAPRATAAKAARKRARVGKCIFWKWFDRWCCCDFDNLS